MYNYVKIGLYMYSELLHVSAKHVAIFRDIKYKV